MSESDCIKLAEAMGLKDSFGLPLDRNSTFDPFTDVNDDYAVLEWARETWQGKDGYHGHWHQFVQQLWWRWDEYDVIVPYQIGDYARATLRVLKYKDQ